MLRAAPGHWVHCQCIGYRRPIDRLRECYPNFEFRETEATPPQKPRLEFRLPFSVTTTRRIVHPCG